MSGINPYTERSLDMALAHRIRRVDFDDLDWLVPRFGGAKKPSRRAYAWIP
jgi:hypothetical protein